MQVFFTLLDVREKLELWRQDFSQVRPHSSLHDQPPAAFAQQWRPTAAPRPAADLDGRKMLATSSFARVTKLSLQSHETH